MSTSLHWEAGSILDAMLDAVLVVSTEGTIIGANESARRLVKSGPLGLEGQAANSLFEPAAQLNEALARVFAQGELCCKEMSVRTSDGSQVPVGVSARVVKVPAGAVVGAVLVLRDIRARLQAEAEHRAVEDRYRLFIDSFQGIAFFGQLDYSPLFLRGAVREITGYSEDEFLSGRVRWRDIIHPEDLLRMRGASEKLRAVPNYIVTRDYRVVRKDSSIGWVRETIRNVCDQSGTPTYLLAVVNDASEHRQALTELAALSQLRESITESARMFSAVVDLGGRVRSWNRAAELLTGYPRDQVQGASDVWMLLLPDAADRARLFSTSGAAAEPVELEAAIVTKDGVERVLSWLSRPLFGPTGEHEGSMLMAQDLTALRQAERALVESEAGFRALAESLPDGIGIVGADGRHRYVNRRGAELLGRTVEEMLGLHVRDIIRPDDTTWVMDRLHRRIAGEPAPARYELTAVRQDGTEVPVEINASRIVWAGEPATLVLVRDITERRTRDQALHDSEEFCASLLRALPYAVTATDLEGTITYVSSEALRMHGVARAEKLLGRNALELLAPEEHARARTNIERTRAGETLKGVEYVMLRRDGSRFRAELNATLLRDGRGRPSGFLATVRELKSE